MPVKTAKVEVPEEIDHTYRKPPDVKPKHLAVAIGSNVAPLELRKHNFKSFQAKVFEIQAASARKKAENKEDETAYNNWLASYTVFNDGLAPPRKERNGRTKAGNLRYRFVNKQFVCTLEEGDYFGDIEDDRHGRGDYPTREKYDRMAKQSQNKRIQLKYNSDTDLTKNVWKAPKRECNSFGIVVKGQPEGFEHMNRPPTFIQIIEETYKKVDQFPYHTELRYHQFKSGSKMAYPQRRGDLLGPTKLDIFRREGLAINHNPSYIDAESNDTQLKDSTSLTQYGSTVVKESAKSMDDAANDAILGPNPEKVEHIFDHKAHLKVLKNPMHHQDSFWEGMSEEEKSYLFRHIMKQQAVDRVKPAIFDRQLEDNLRYWNGNQSRPGSPVIRSLNGITHRSISGKAIVKGLTDCEATDRMLDVSSVNNSSYDRLGDKPRLDAYWRLITEEVRESGQGISCATQIPMHRLASFRHKDPKEQMKRYWKFMVKRKRVDPGVLELLEMREELNEKIAGTLSLSQRLALESTLEAHVQKSLEPNMNLPILYQPPVEPKVEQVEDVVVKSESFSATSILRPAPEKLLDFSGDYVIESGIYVPKNSSPFEKHLGEVVDKNFSLDKSTGLFIPNSILEELPAGGVTIENFVEKREEPDQTFSSKVVEWFSMGLIK